MNLDYKRRGGGMTSHGDGGYVVLSRGVGGGCFV